MAAAAASQHQRLPRCVTFVFLLQIAEIWALRNVLKGEYNLACLRPCNFPQTLSEYSCANWHVGVNEWVHPMHCKKNFSHNGLFTLDILVRVQRGWSTLVSLGWSVVSACQPQLWCGVQCPCVQLHWQA